MWLAFLAVAMIATHAILASRLLTERDDLIIRYTPVEALIYALAVLVVLRDKGGDTSSTKRVVVFILVIAGLLRGMVLTIDPVSTDINRYIWDGRVQDAGINPYLYVPADPALKPLRDDDIYPEINRKSYAPTIYPPFAQIVFYLVTRIDEDIVVMKAVMVAFDALAIFAIMRLLKARHVAPQRVLLYAWHPVPIWEFAGSGHLDAIAVACVCLGLLAAQKGRPILAGIALAGATLTKIFPIVIGPAVYRRWDWKLPVAGVATILALYVPYLGAGRKLFGFLGGYSGEEGMRDGTGVYPWLLLRHLCPALPATAFVAYIAVAFLILLALEIAILFRHHAPESGAARGHLDLPGAFILAVAFTALISPHYDWYLAWLIPFLCFMPCWSVIWLTGASTMMIAAGWPPDFVGGSLIFLPFFAIACCEVTIRGLRPKGKHDESLAVIGSGRSPPSF
jgi:hypothetical protein